MHKVYDPKLQWNPDVQYDIEEYCPECGNILLWRSTEEILGSSLPVLFADESCYSAPCAPSAAIGMKKPDVI